MRESEQERQEPRFIADCMLGTLAKRLRFLGYDTLFFNRIEDADLVKIAVDQGRMIITRDSGIIKRKAAKNYIFIETDDLEIQMNMVFKSVGIERNPSKAATRCILCNTPLLPLVKREAIGKVPPFVFLTHSKFTRCSQCRRIYWKGSHMEKALERLSSGA